MRHRIVFLVLLVVVQTSLHAQARPTASRSATLQLGGGVSTADSGIYPDRFKGIFLFADLDLTPHFGGEFEVRQVNTPYDNHVNERTYEVGVRYHRTCGRLEPFTKVMVGRGVFQYPRGVATIAYNLYAAGAGADIRLTSRVFARAEYEYQRWNNFNPGELSPSLIEGGAVYRF